MSLLSIRAALEVALNTLSPALATAYENVPFVPVPKIAYQRVNVLPANPENPSIGNGLHREIGVLQVTLCYPLNAGSQSVTTRAEAIRSLFVRGSSFTAGSVTLHIDSTPAIGPGRTVDDRWVVPVSASYHADIFSP